MRLQICLAFLCCLAAVAIVQSESTIEVDENGDEYEVKRFNIEGRQLNGGRSQCVETRRKRSIAAVPSDGPASGSNMSNNESNLNNKTSSDSSGNNSTRRKGGDFVSMMTTPSGDIETETPDEEGDDIFNVGEGIDSNGEMLAGDSNQGGGDDDDYDYDYEVEPPKSQMSAVPQSGLEVSNLDSSNIVVVQANQPPKVNPQTHAVFQLLPVNAEAQSSPINHALQAAANVPNEDGELHFAEDIDPVTTTAIWSTGADDDVGDDDDGPLNALYDEYEMDKDDMDDIDMDIYNDKDQVKPSKGDKNSSKKPAKKPATKPATKPAKQPPKQPAKKPAKNPAKKPGRKPAKKPDNNKPNKRPSKSGNKNKNPNNKKKGNKKQPQRRKQRRPGHKNRRPMTGNRKGPKTGGNRVRPNKRFGTNNRNRRNKNNGNRNRFNQNANRRFNVNLNNRDIKRQKNKNDFVKDKGTRTFTKTVTMTQTGPADDEKDLNCIIIRKDPPPTTARPFWNILGRNAEGTGRSGPFGQRKRVNLRFAPKQE